MAKTESKRTGPVLAGTAVIIFLLRQKIRAAVVAVVESLDSLFGATNNSTKVLMWCVAGILIGAIYGSAAAIKKYRLPKKEVLLPAGALVLFILISQLSR